VLRLWSALSLPPASIRTDLLLFCAACVCAGWHHAAIVVQEPQPGSASAVSASVSVYINGKLVHTASQKALNVRELVCLLGLL
jgi:hypothetical protein